MEVEGENQPSILAMPAFKGQCATKPSKELKMYKRPPQTITNFFLPAKSNVEVQLHEIPAFQSCVTQTSLLPNSQLDLKSRQSSCNRTIEMFAFQMSFGTEPMGAVYEDVATCASQGSCRKSNNSGKSAKSEGTPSSFGKREMMLEFTDSEDEESIIPVNKDTGILLYYSCKHCNYNDLDIDNLSTHYQSDHPYIRFQQVYIQDPCDQSATFRCLNCPVEFLSLSDLNSHNAENHPHSPDLFMIQSGDLAFKCFACAFTTSALEEIKTHYKEKHPTHEVNSALTFCRYLVDTQEEQQLQLSDGVKALWSDMPQQCSPETSLTSSKGVEDVPSNGHQSPGAQNSAPTDCVMTHDKSSLETNDPYQYPEKLFYCQTCNCAKITAKGVLLHQARAHHHGTGIERVLEYSTKVRDEMKHLKSQAEDSSFTCSLPLPILQKGEENAFFCHLCNYRRDDMYWVLKHYCYKHDKWKMESDQVEEHTSNILKQIKDMGLRERSGQKLCQTLLDGDEIGRKRTKKHRKGSAHTAKKRKQSEEWSDPAGTDNSPPTLRSKQGETRRHSCKACSYKCTSISEIAQHYRAVHQGSLEEDGSALHRVSKRITRSHRLLEGHTEPPPSFESYQVPLEFEDSPEKVTSPEKIQRPSCPETSPTQRCTDDPCQKTHQDDVVENPNEQMDEQSNASFAHPGKLDPPLHVFRCPYCPYVNSRRLGVFSHSSVIHPSPVLRTESFYLKTKNMMNVGSCLQKKGSTLILQGYMCKNCPQIFSNRTEHSMHLKEVHCENTAESESVSKPESGSEAQDCLYKCGICFSVYSSRKSLRKHCIAKHGGKCFFENSSVTPATTATEASVDQQSNSEADDPTVTSEDNTVSLFKCPKCPYVNVTVLGFRMHCQKKHPTVLASGIEKFQEKESIDTLDKFLFSKGFNSGGYMCKKCHHIFCSTAVLKSHLRKEHQSCKDSVSVLDQPENDPTLSRPPPPQRNGSLHGCKLCPYKGSYQRCLSDHYKNKHKLDWMSRCRILVDTAAGEGSQAAVTNESGEVSHLQCRTCPHVESQSSQQLVSHRSTVQPAVRAFNFIVLVPPSKKSTGQYKCSVCSKRINGAKLLCAHLDQHRESERKATVDPGDPAAPRHHVPPGPETEGDPAELNTPPDPQSHPENPPTLERMEPPPHEEPLACKHCGRVFRYQKSLDSHERSHATLAAIRKKTTLSTSSLKHSLNKYIVYKAGNRQPFLCTLCRYRTTIVSLLKRHLAKKHECVVKGLSITDSQESIQSTENEAATQNETLNDAPEHLEDPPASEGLSYSEAPEVQRQLDYYNKMAHASDTSAPDVQEVASPATGSLRCELCSYSAGRLPTLRKHYSARHGKKMLTCTSCSFVTSSKKSMKTHSDGSHSCSERLAAAAQQGDLSCPFCLYQTKNKNYMIDHIVLHREVRVVPIEPCRPQLSRYLQGLVHRCHKCTFTSGSAESLRLHMIKHDDTKPYKCRLCYFDCTQLSELEAHLSDKHQVLRNHELVGQVSLDQLEARHDRPSQEQVQPVSLVGEATDCDQVSKETQTESLVEIKIEETIEEDACQSPTPAEVKDLERSDGQAAERFLDSETEKRPEVTAGEGDNVKGQTNEEAVQIQENKTQLNLKNCDGNRARKSSLKEKLVHLCEGSPDTRLGLLLKERMFNNSDAKIEEHILRRMLQLEKDSSTIKMRRKSELDLPLKAEMKVKEGFSHHRQRDYLLFRAKNRKKQDGPEVTSTLSKTSPTKSFHVRNPSHCTLERHWLTRWLHRQRKLGTNVVFTASNDKQRENPGSSEKAEDSCGQNEDSSGERHRVRCCGEEDDEVTHRGKKPSREEDGATDRAEVPCASEGSLSRTGAQATSLACDFCGRRLASSYQLERHIVQHGK